MDSTRRRQRHILSRGHFAALILVWLLAALPASAKVLIKTTLSPNPVQVGERVHLRIDRIEDLTAAQPTLQTPNPEFPIIPGLTLLSSQVGQNISTHNQQVRVLLRYDFVLMPTEKGNFPIPPLSMGYDQEKHLLSEGLTLHVQAPPGQSGSPLFWLLLFGVLPLIGVGVWFLRRKSRKEVKPQLMDRVTVTVQDNSAPVTPAKTSQILPRPDSLETLRSAFRAELGLRFCALPSGLTSQEIVNWLKNQGLGPSLLDELEIYLHHCDHLRFQPQGVDADELALLHQQAERILMQLKA